MSRKRVASPYPLGQCQYNDDQLKLADEDNLSLRRRVRGRWAKRTLDRWRRAVCEMLERYRPHHACQERPSESSRDQVKHARYHNLCNGCERESVVAGGASQAALYVWTPALQTTPPGRRFMLDPTNYAGFVWDDGGYSDASLWDRNHRRLDVDLRVMHVQHTSLCGDCLFVLGLRPPSPGDTVYENKILTNEVRRQLKVRRAMPRMLMALVSTFDEQSATIVSAYLYFVWTLSL